MLYLVTWEQVRFLMLVASYVTLWAILLIRGQSVGPSIRRLVGWKAHFEIFCFDLRMEMDAQESRLKLTVLLPVCRFG